MNKLSWMFAVAVASISSVAQGQPSATVTAWARHFGGQVVYSYELRNAGGAPIKRFWIGAVAPSNSGDGRYEAEVLPNTSSSSFWVGPDASSSPAGWGVSMSFEEETPRYALEWIEAKYLYELFPKSRAPGSPAVQLGETGIAPMTTRAGFSVTLPEEEAALVKGHAIIEAGDTAFTVPLIPGDQEAPRITLALDRLNHNGGHGEWAIFKVAYAVTDNYDPLPATEFSVVASPAAGPADVVQARSGASAWNLKLRNVKGRTYTIRVRAVDATGNAAQQTYRYAVGD